jgi:hypothetical protein
LLAEIAVARLSGSPSHERILQILKRELAARGFGITEHRFAATAIALQQVAFAGFVAAGIGTAVLLGGFLGQGGSPTIYVLLGLGLLAGVLGTPLGRAVLEKLGGGGHSAAGVNLIAIRRGELPRVWLTAHFDSKGQIFSMVVRLVLVSCTAVGGGALMVLAVLTLVGITPDPRYWTGAAIAGLAGAPLMFNASFRSSPGAVDNASGVTTVLAILDRLPRDSAVGVVFPDAEEWGLVGAAALVRDHAELFQTSAIVNFDGIDDCGGVTTFVHRAGRVSSALVAAFQVRAWSVLPVVVDGVAFARAAPDCVTIMRGNLATMRVVHTRRDTADRLTLAGVEKVASTVAAALRALLT